MRLFKNYIFTLFIIALFSCSPRALLNRSSEKTEAKVEKQSDSFDIQQQFKQITTHPETDMMPALSPDGRWIAFASKRSGNMDIWVKLLQGGRSIQVTTHQADDLYPCWHPDGKKLVFVSQREDAAGDLWQLNINTRRDIFTIVGKPRKITNYLGQDDAPAFSPNEKMIAFTSDRDGQNNIWLYSTRKKKFYQLTRYGGINPTWSPDGKQIAFISFRNGSNSGGDLFLIDVPPPENLRDSEYQEKNIIALTSGNALDAFPSWNPADSSIVFTRYFQDTNGDGIINPSDQGNIWKYSLKDFTEFQLLAQGSYDYIPHWEHTNFIQFCSDRSDNMDIWQVRADGPIPRQENAFLQYQFAELYYYIPENISVFERKSSLNETEFHYYRLLAFQRVLDFFPEDATWSMMARLEIARSHILLNDVESATRIFKQILQEDALQKEIGGKVRWELLSYNLQTHRDDTGYLSERIAEIKSLKKEFDTFNSLAAKYQMMLGEVYAFTGDIFSALSSYQNLTESYPQQREYCAIAHSRIAKIYDDFGRPEDAIDSYLKIIDKYPEQEKWVNLALARILETTHAEDVYESIAANRSIIEKYSAYPRLAARAQTNMGKLLLANGEYDKAIVEFSLVARSYPEQRREIAQAELLKAETYIRKNEDLLAINRLNSIIRDFGDVDGGLYVVEAKEQLIDFYLTTAKRLRNSGDFPLAYQRYYGVVQLQPGNLEAHRGLVFTLSRMNRLDDAVTMYTTKLEKNPEDEVSRYVLGLCYSYKATERSERSRKIDDLNYALIKKSNETIEEALEKNYRLIPAYLALSYNYEVIEKYENYQRTKETGFLTKSLNAISAPLVSLFKFITFQKEKPPERWYEKAIDALTTAIALNDETEEPQLESELALNLAHNYYNLEEFGYERAYHYYHQKIKYDSTFISKDFEAEIYKRMGRCALVLEDFERGANYLKKAATLYRELGESGQVLLNTKRLAFLYQLAGEYDESIVYFREAVETEEGLKLWNEVEKSYRNIAYNYQLLNDEEEAIRYAQKAVALLKSGRIRVVQSKPNWIKIGILGWQFPVYDLGPIGAGESTAIEGFTTDEETALVYSIMADAYLQQTNYEKVIEYHQKKLTIYRERKDKFAEAIFLNNIGYFYYRSEKYNQALDYFARSLTICKGENLTAGIISNIINLGALGVLHQKMSSSGEYRTNQAAFQKTVENLKYGLELYSTADDIGFQREKVQLLNLLGNMYFLNGVQIPDSLRGGVDRKIAGYGISIEQYATAEEFYEQALVIAREQNYMLESIVLYQNLGYLYLNVREYRESYIAFNQARNLSIRNNYSDMLWRTNAAVAVLLEPFTDEQREWLGARRSSGFYYREAIDVLTGILRQERFHYTQFYARETRQLFESAVRFFERDDPEYALELTEKMRAKEYLDLFSTHKILLKKEWHKNYLGLARDDNRLISELEEQIRSARNAPEVDEQNIDELEERRQQRIAEYSKLLTEMKEEDPELESMVRVNPVSITAFQNILNTDTGLLNYFVTENRTYVWLIDRDSVQKEILPVGREKINRLVGDFREAVQNPAPNGKVPAAAMELRDRLITPLKNFYENYQTILIVSDEELYQIPFSFIFNLNEQKYYAVNIPSMSSYYYIYQKRKIAGDRIFIVDNESLESAVQSNGFTVIPNNDPTAIRHKIEDCDILHLKLRIDWHDVDPLMTKILLPSDVEISEKNIYSFDMKANLAVLNSDILMDEASATKFSSFNRAIFYAGTPTILYKLWAMNPESEKRFYSYFYEYLRENSPAQALSLAQERMRSEQNSYRDWAGYQLVGFEGMTNEEQKRFAVEQFERQVRLANVSYEEQDWTDAVRDYEQALNMAEKLGADQYVERLRRLIIQTAVNGQNYQKAIDFQTQILEDAESSNNARKVSESYQYLVVFYDRKKEYSEAAKYQAKYIDYIRRRAPAKALAKAYNQLGLLYEKNLQYEAAIENYGISIQMYQAIDDMLGVATNLKDRGRIYLTHLDYYLRAIEDQKRALDLFQEEGDDINQIDALQNMGLAYEKMADYRNALEYQRKALTLAEEADDQSKIALSQQYIANIKWKQDEYQEAMQYQNSALQRFMETGSEKLQAMALSTLGLIRRSLGQTVDALDAQNRALELAKKIDDMKDQATIHKNIGLIHLSNNNLSLARDEFEKALAIDMEVDYKRGLAYDYRNLGSVYSRSGKPDSAVTFLNKAYQLSREINDSRNVAQSLYELGLTYFTINDHMQALDLLKQAAEQSQYLLIQDIEWRALRAQGQVFESQDKLDSAEVYFIEAMHVIEEMRSRIKVEEFKSGFIDNKLDVYNDLIVLLLRMGKKGKALEIVERAKSRNFLDMLANRSISFRGEMSDELVAEGREIQEQIAASQSAVAQLRSRLEKLTFPEQERLAVLEDSLSSLRQKYADYLVKLKSENAELAEMMTVDPDSFEEIQESIQDSVAYLEYYISKDKLLIWGVTKNDVHAAIIEQSDSVLNALVEDYRDAMDKQLSVELMSGQLYNMLIKPVEEKLNGIEHLVIIPHNILHYLPFAALVDDEGRYLIEEYTISLSPSAAVLKICLDKGNKFINSSRWQQNFIAFGNPDL
ncbi:tetratricopeptide repeat protein, partial [candidate division KSB1 bacterium]|nr:tetratricopeptide repeat protein [candidate division KSB1 bacterium]